MRASFLLRDALSAGGGNLISMTNILNFGASAYEGIPRMSRIDARHINQIHETDNLILLGRNRCNHFGNNQYMLISKASKRPYYYRNNESENNGDSIPLRESFLIGASDDFMEDWIEYAVNADAPIRHCFLTHLHIDDILSLSQLYNMVGPGLQSYYNPSDEVWIRRFPECCRKYRRHELENAKIPLGPGYNNNWLTCLTNRTTTFIEFGGTFMYYIYTPGHSNGHTMLHLPLEKLAFTGDLIFSDGIGRVDIPYGDSEKMTQSLRVLEEFPDNTILLPSHGRITTMGRERRRNPGLIRAYELIATGKRLPKVGLNAKFF